MSKYSLKITQSYAKTLPSFQSLKEARNYYDKYRNEMLLLMKKIPKRFNLDFTPDSLKTLEQLYFALVTNNNFSKFLTTKENFEKFMGIYFGEVLVTTCHKTKWIVQEYAFQKNKYELGVKNARGNLIMLTNAFINHDKIPHNKRHHKLYREFQKYCSP